MTLQNILNSLQTPSWVTAPEELLQHQGHVVLTKKESRWLLDQACDALAANHSQDAANYIYAGLVLDSPRFLEKLQKDGILRISRYSYQPQPLTPVVSLLLTPDIGLSPETAAYLRSVQNLYQVAKSVRTEYEQLREWLAKEREMGVKSALAWLDFLFLKKAVGIHETNKVHIDSRHPFFFTVEELAEGLSSILALYGEEFGDLRLNPQVSEDAPNRECYFAFLVSGSHISTFREWEFQVDRQGYRLLETKDTGTYRLDPPSAEFGRAVELGFIQTFQQHQIKASDWFDKNSHSFHTFAPRAVKSMKDAGFIRIVQKPVPRYRFDFPDEVLTLTAGIGELFLEERLALLGASRDLLTPAQQLLEFDLGDGLTLRHFFLVSRLMQFVRSITAAILIPELEKRPTLAFQSLIPVFQREALADLLGTVIGKEMAEKTITMMCSDIRGHVDVQYQPLIPVGKELLLPANVFANSNVYRNPQVVLQRRLYEDGSVDPLSDALDKAFKAKNFASIARAEYSWNGQKGEIDVLVLINSTLFAFECKNSLVPTGVHELMTSLDYIRTAAAQLDRFQQCFADTQFRHKLSNEAGLAIDSSTQLATGIIMSNRMFAGLRINGHPVRGYYELEHFIDKGEIAMGQETHSYWLGDSFAGEDLGRFLQEDITYQAQWACMKDFSETYKFDGCSVLVSRFYLDMLELADYFGFVKAKQGLLDQQAAHQKAVKEFSLVKECQARQREYESEARASTEQRAKKKEKEKQKREKKRRKLKRKVSRDTKRKGR